MSEPRCHCINGSSDIDLPWFESRTRSILAVPMLKSPNQQASTASSLSVHCVSKYVILQNLTVLNLQSYQIDLTFCNFAKSTFSSCNLLDQTFPFRKLFSFFFGLSDSNRIRQLYDWRTHFLIWNMVSCVTQISTAREFRMVHSGHNLRVVSQRKSVKVKTFLCSIQHQTSGHNWLYQFSVFLYTWWLEFRFAICFSC